MCTHTHHHAVCVTWKSDCLLANYIIKPTGQSLYFSDVNYQHFHFDWWRHLYWNKEAIHLGGLNHHNLSHPVPHSDLTCTMVDELWLFFVFWRTRSSSYFSSLICWQFGPIITSEATSELTTIITVDYQLSSVLQNHPINNFLDALWKDSIPQLATEVFPEWLL